MHQLIAPGLTTEFPPLRSLGTLASDLSIVDTQAIYPVAGFSGREAELAAIEGALAEDGAIAALQGMGGVGKSSLAREYAWRSRERFSAVWWLGAQTEEGIIDALLGLGAMFVTGLDQLADRRSAARRVVNSILAGFDKPTLLVFDNLEDERLLRTWFPRSGSKALVTSRNTAWPTDMTAISLHPWSLKTAAGYLRRESGRADVSKGDAYAIAAALGALPLAIAHAAAYLRELRMVTPRRYLEHITDRLENAPRNADYPRSVFATFRTAIAQAEQQASGSAAVLCFAASFASDGIPDELFRQSLENYAVRAQPIVPEGTAFDLRSVVANQIQLDEALGVLDRLSLLTFSERSRTYSIHRLVQLAARRELVARDRSAWYECAVRVAYAAFPAPEFASWPQCARLLSQARAAMEALPDEVVFLPAASLAHRCAVYLWKRGEYGMAMELDERALVIREKALGPEHPDVAESLSGLAILFRDEGCYEKAEALHRRVLMIREKVLGPDHLDVAHTLNNLAIVYSDQGRHEEAEFLHKRAQAIREKALGHEHPDVGSSLNNLAVTYEAQQRYEEAHQLYERALAIRQGALGPDHPDVANSLMNLADLHRERGRYEEADPLFERSLAIREQARDLEHPDAAYCMRGLANVYTAEGRYEEAKPLYERALAIFQKLGAQHPDLAMVLSDFAGWYEAQELREDADRLYVRALAIQEKRVGHDHAKTKEVRERLDVLRSK